MPSIAKLTLILVFLIKSILTFHFDLRMGLKDALLKNYLKKI